MNNAKLQELNTRLKRGEGWIGYRTSKGSNGEKLPSKFLYFAFYQGSQQKFVNSKTNDPEEAYRQLLDARRATIEGVRLLPSEVSRIRYEDLRAILLDYYREHKPRSISSSATREIPTAQEISSLGKSLRVPTSWRSSSNGCRSPKLRRRRARSSYKGKEKQATRMPLFGGSLATCVGVYTSRVVPVCCGDHVLHARVAAGRRVGEMRRSANGLSRDLRLLRL